MVSSSSSSPTPPRVVVKKRVVIRKGGTRQGEPEEPFPPRWVRQQIRLSALAILLVGLWVAIATCQFHDSIVRPYLLQHGWTAAVAENEFYYDLFACEEQDMTANSPTEFLWNHRNEDDQDDTNSSDDTNSNEDENKKDTKSQKAAVDQMLHHGMGIFRQVLSPTTAANLREHIVQQMYENKEDTIIPVIQKENRWSAGLQVSHEPVWKALHELTNGTVLQQAQLLTQVLEALLGPNFSVVELSAIVAREGAAEQHWHADTTFAASTVVTDHFAPMYTILIPLQDTLPHQGATWTCPGTHRCRQAAFCGHGAGFPIFTATNENDDPVWKAGDALVYSSALQHRGGAHTATGAPDRVALIVSVASRLARQLPLGPAYGIRHDQWGTNWQDWAQESTARQLAGTTPFGQQLQALGLVTTAGSSRDNRGWTYLQSAVTRMMNGDYYFRFIDLQSMVNGRVGWLGSLPWIVQGRLVENDPYAPWPAYLASVCRNIRNVLFLATLMLLVSCVKNYSDQGGTLERRSLAVLLSVFCVLVVLTTSWILVTPPWSVNWKASESPPMGAFSSYIHSLAAPVYKDILLSHRPALQPTVLAQSRRLEFHPSTRAWMKATASCMPLWLSYCDNSKPAALSRVFLSAVLDSILDAPSIQGKRMLQLNQWGDWRDLSREQARHETLEQLLHSFNLPIRENHPCQNYSLKPVRGSSIICAVSATRKILLAGITGAQQLPPAGKMPSALLGPKIHARLSQMPPFGSSQRTQFLVRHPRNTPSICGAVKDEQGPVKEEDGPPPAGAPVTAKTTFEVGDRVEIHPNGYSRRWAVGTIHRASKNGVPVAAASANLSSSSYVVLLDSGALETVDQRSTRRREKDG